MGPSNQLSSIRAYHTTVQKQKRPTLWPEESKSRRSLFATLRFFFVSQFPAQSITVFLAPKLFFPLSTSLLPEPCAPPRPAVPISVFAPSSPVVARAHPPPYNPIT